MPCAFESCWIKHSRSTGLFVVCFSPNRRFTVLTLSVSVLTLHGVRSDGCRVVESVEE